MSPIALVITIGLVFSPLAALVAFLTIYTEHTRGPNPDKRLALRLALQTALVTLVVFVALAIGIAFFVVDVVLK